MFIAACIIRKNITSRKRPGTITPVKPMGHNRGRVRVSFDKRDSFNLSVAQVFLRSPAQTVTVFSSMPKFSLGHS